MQDTILIVAGYLLGSISSAIVVSSAMGLPDPRTQGSGNPGATNVLRTGGKKAAAITLIGDLLKGLIPVLVAKLLGASLEVQLLVAMAAFLGHLYPIFFRFSGGKGVATAAGVLLGLNWQVGITALIIWLIVFKLKKISSLSALTSTALSPVYIWLLTGSGWFVVFGVALAALIFWRHRSNIEKLLQGTEG